MPVFTNIAAYKFAPLADLKTLRETLLAKCKSWGLKGTILLSTEGINLFVAGGQDDVEKLLAELRRIPGLETLQAKYSESAEQPFRRMLVRIKKEIIAFGVPGVDPSRRTSPKISAQTLKQWLDEGRKLTLLDTRNDYEVKLGTFENALPIGIDHFRHFPEAVEKLPAEMKEQPIVMFCTGGIRCEKAGPFMEMKGFREIYQLEGGILKYFEECGSEHYKGECFVFDQRVGVDPALHETGSSQCFACQTPLTEEEQQDPRYVPNVSCPYCFKTEEEQLATTIQRREAEFAAVTTPLPGSQAYDNLRPIHISGSHDGQTLLSFLTSVFSHVPEAEWHERFAAGLILSPGGAPARPDQIVRGGEIYRHIFAATREPDVNPAVRVLHEDEAIIVISKPAPLPMHPGGRFNRNTLQYFLNEVYAPQRPKPAHRLDANTTGVVVFSRTRHYAGMLQPQFSRGDVTKTYLVRVNGSPVSDRFVSESAISVEPGELGSRQVDAAGLPARTEFQVIHRFEGGTSLLEARPITGRTNQIRIHLWELGWPVVGDQVYRENQTLGDTQTLSVNDAPLCLHSWKIAFTHPLTKERVSFEAAKPAWAITTEIAGVV